MHARLVETRVRGEIAKRGPRSRIMFATLFSSANANRCKRASADAFYFFIFAPSPKNPPASGSPDMFRIDVNHTNGVDACAHERLVTQFVLTTC